MSVTELRTCPYCGTPDKSGDFHILDLREKMQPKEWLILETLYNAHGQAIPNERLYDILFSGFGHDWPENYKIQLNVYICRMRKKLKNTLYEIVSVKGGAGRGYKLHLKNRKEGIYYDLTDESGKLKSLILIQHEILELAYNIYQNKTRVAQELGIGVSTVKDRLNGGQHNGRLLGPQFYRTQSKRGKLIPGGLKNKRT